MESSKKRSRPCYESRVLRRKLLLASASFDPTRTTDSYTSDGTMQEWKDVLELASRWRMNKVSNTAVCHLSRMELDPITKLELARKHNIQDNEWRLSSIRALVKDDTELTEGHANLIGCDLALKIARIQGMVHVKSKQLFVNDDEWKQFMDGLAKEGMFGDGWQFATTLPFPPPQSILGMKKALGNYCSSLPFPASRSMLLGTKDVCVILLICFIVRLLL